MAVETLAGQRFMIGFGGTVLDNELKYLIDTIKIGGVVLFSRNIQNPSQLKTLCDSIQNYARSCGLPPLIIAVDQEGGEVARLKAPFTVFPGNSKMKNEEDARNFATTTAEELSKVGINMDLAPVLDITPKNIKGIMSNRSFGHDPRWVSRLGGEVISKLQQNGIMAVVKHFPGIGRATRDPHDDWMTLNTDFSVLKTTDLVPFENAIILNVSGVMLSHLRYNQIDARWPASLSVKIAGDLLRRKMNFKGIVMTDDMDMGAIEKHYDIKTVVARVLKAEIDMMLICHRSPNIETAFETACRTLHDSAQMKSNALASANRIYQQKRAYLGNLFVPEQR
jgi:beta-N-acetylhexosaminidase